MAGRTRGRKRLAAGRLSQAAAPSRSPWLGVRDAVSRKVLGRTEAGKDFAVMSGGCRSCWQMLKHCSWSVNIKRVLRCRIL